MGIKHYRPYTPSRRNMTTSTFEEVTKRFSDTAMENMTLYGKAYGIPFLQGFAVMFVRDDVMQKMGLDVPETWDELIALIPTFQFNNMDIGFQADYRNFIYQRGGSLWEDEGLRTAFDSDESVDAFSWLVNLYNQYDMNKEFEAANRFKSGEMPIILSDYQLYNTLQVFAPEIANLWSFYQLPGIKDPETGEINRTIATEPDGVYMTRDCRDPERWNSVCWIHSIFLLILVVILLPGMQTLRLTAVIRKVLILEKHCLNMLLP